MGMDRVRPARRPASARPQAISTLGSVTASLPFFPVYTMQLATSYMNLALPSNLARLAINIRFFQRQGIQPAAAVTAGAIDSFASTILQALLLVGLLSPRRRAWTSTSICPRARP